MIDFNDVKDGWDFMADQLGVDAASKMAVDVYEEYVRQKELADGASTAGVIDVAGVTGETGADGVISLTGATGVDLPENFKIDYVSSALSAGLTASMITSITQMVPEIYKAIDYLIKNKELDMDEVKESGEVVLDSGAEGFLRGSISCCVMLKLQEGILGETIARMNPSIIGTAASIIMNTIKDSIMVAAGLMSGREMGDKFVDNVVLSSGYVGSMLIGGTIGQVLLPMLPIVGYALGSLLGCSLSIVYNIGKKRFISLCIDTGFTCFGLVDQDYEIPEEILKQIGITTIPVARTPVSRIEISQVHIQDDIRGDIQRIRYETIDMKVLERGLIGVNRVGYVRK